MMFYCVVYINQLAVDEVNRRNIASLFLPIDPVNPFLVLQVSRSNLVQDTIMQLTKQAVMDLKKPLKVPLRPVLSHFVNFT